MLIASFLEIKRHPPILLDASFLKRRTLGKKRDLSPVFRHLPLILIPFLKKHLSMVRVFQSCQYPKKQCFPGPGGPLNNDPRPCLYLEVEILPDPVVFQPASQFLRFENERRFHHRLNSDGLIGITLFPIADHSLPE